MHVKRQTIQKTWPIPRKGTKYIIVASHNKKTNLPILIILRDMLKVAKDRKEVKRILQEAKISLNNKVVKREELTVSPFDIIKIGNKNYELVFSDRGKFILRETARKEQILKIIGKKILRGKKIQLNLMYGKNILVDNKEKAKIKIGDSAIIENEKIVKILPTEIGREAIILDGKYRGKEGKIEKIEHAIATILYKKEKINVPIKNILAIKWAKKKIR